MAIRTYLLAFVLCAVSPLMSQERSIYFSGGDGYSDLFRVDLDRTVSRLTTRESRGEYQPQVSPDARLIVFNTYRYGGWKLAIAELENGDIKSGSIKKLLSNSKGYEYDADWSADGQSIVFVGFTNGRSGYRQIFITDVQGKKVRQLTSNGHNHYAPHFSHDGKSIYYQINIDGIYAIERLIIESGKTEPVCNSKDWHAIAPSLSSNGSLLAFQKYMMTSL
ncbi:MAG: hypothetical protein ABJG47_15560 [Ekhidna sp.]